MKSIIVAIDFSKGSIHALKYAIHIANRAGADINMIWVDNTSSSEVVYSQFTNEERLEHKKSFEELKNEYRGQLKNGHLDFLMRKGKVHQEVAKAARQKDADLIIAGTHGVTGYEEYWIGSNAYRIVTYAPCPVITIRNDYTFGEGIHDIIFPIDSSVETKQKLPFTAGLAQMFNARIHVLGLYSTNLKSLQKRIDNNVDHVLNYLKKENITYNEHRERTDNMTRLILKFADEQEADLIAIMTEQESTQANVFLGQTSEQLISHAQTPILSLRPKNLKEIP